jgi:hypothetical protein
MIRKGERGRLVPICGLALVCAALSACTNRLYEIIREDTLPKLPELIVLLESRELSAAETVDFGSTVKDLPKEITFRIENRGEGDLNLTGDPKRVEIGVQSGSAFTVAEQPEAKVIPGTSTSFVIRFLPTAEREYSATVIVTNNDESQGSFSFAVVGAGTLQPEPEMELEQAGGSLVSGGSFDYGDVVMDPFVFYSSEVEFTVRNLGSADLLLSNTPRVSVTGSSTYAVKTQPSAVIAPGGATSFILSFTPLLEITHEATVSILSNDPDEGLFSFSVSGNGTKPDVIVRLDGADFGADGTFDFGAEMVGQSSRPVEFVIENTGTGPLNVVAVLLSDGDTGDFSVDTTGMDSVVVAGGSTSFTVSAVPLSAGTRSASVVVASHDEDESSYRFTVTAESLWGVDFGDSTESSAEDGSFTMDTAGNLYFVYTRSSGGGSDWRVVKCNSSGTVAWALDIDGGGSPLSRDSVRGVAVDNAGSTVYVFGTGEDLVGSDSGFDWWIKKFSSLGVELDFNPLPDEYPGSGAEPYNSTNGLDRVFDGSTTTASTPVARARAIALDLSGNVYVTGEASFLVYSASGSMDWWIKKFSSSGEELDINPLPDNYPGSGTEPYNSTNGLDRVLDGSGGVDIPYAITVSSGNDIYVVGSGTDLVSGTSGEDWWVKKFDSSGSELWEKKYDANGSADSAYAVAVSGVNVYVAGSGYDAVAADTGSDWWIKKLNSSGVEQDYNPLPDNYRGSGTEPYNSTNGLDRLFDYDGDNDIIYDLEIHGLDLYAAGRGRTSGPQVCYDWWIKRLYSSGSDDTVYWDKKLDYGRGSDSAIAIEIDSSGNVFVAGSVQPDSASASEFIVFGF